MGDVPTRWQRVKKDTSDLIEGLTKLVGVALVAYCVWVLYGYHKDEDAAKARAVRDVPDPAAAQFRNVKVLRVQRKDKATDTLTVVCGEVNNKNQYGAYSGYTEFTVYARGYEPLLWLPFDGLFAADDLEGICAGTNLRWTYKEGWFPFLLADTLGKLK